MPHRRGSDLAASCIWETIRADLEKKIKFVVDFPTA